MSSTLSQIGYSGLQAAQLALTASGQNVANVNTPGFSRLKAEQHSLAGQSRLAVGGGVQVTSIRRMVGEFQNQQLQRANTEQHYRSSRQDYLTALEALIGNEGSSISAGMDSFFGALSEATTAPESIQLRQQIINDADQLAKRFNGLSGNINAQIGALHGQRQATVSEINALASNLAELNVRIVQLESNGQDTATLRDHRDRQLQELSGYVDIRTLEQANGAVNVTLTNGQPLVSGKTAGQLRVELTGAGEQALALKFSGTEFPVPQRGLGGVLGGLHDVEYGTLRPAIAELHDMAGAIAAKTNAVLETGYDLNGNPGQALFAYDPDSITGMLSVTGLSAQELAFSSEAGLVGNNDVLVQLLDIRQETITVAGADVVLHDAYSGLLGRVASTSRQNQAELDAATAMVQEAQVQRDRISAVDLDEEAINLMTYTQAYQANMRVISTSNDLFASLLAMF